MKTFNIKYFVMLAFLGISTLVWAQDVDEIVSKHIEAHGGCEAWEKIQSMEVKARFTAFSEEDDFYAVKTNDGKYYSKLQLGQFEVIEAFDACKGWTIDPWHDFTFPRDLNKNEVNVFKQKAEFFTPFYKYKEKGSTVRYKGTEKLDGMEMYVLELTRADGKSETWYLNTDTYLEYKSVSPWVDFSVGVPAESYFDDFQEVNGLVLPFFIERTFWQRDRITLIEEINFNVEVPCQLFAMPRSEAMDKLAFLEGEWDVAVAVWTRRGSWYPRDTSTSCISFKATNLLQENITYDNGYAMPKVIHYTYNEHANAYQVFLYNGFSSDMNLYEGGFTDSTFSVYKTRLVSDSIQPPNFVKIQLSDMSEDDFIMEIQRSSDQGKTWRPGQKLTYTRQD